MKLDAAILSVLVCAFPFTVTAGVNPEKLVDAAYRLNVERVEKLLSKGVDVNGKRGKFDLNVFSSPWDGGSSPVGSENWTPLLAVANASELPPPPPEVQNSHDHVWTMEQAGKVPLNELEKCRKLKLKIASMLIEAGADVNVDNGYGATALYEAASRGHLELALLLMENRARVNTKTQAYFDGPSDLTPLHVAVKYPDVVAALIAARADVSAKDSDGNTPLHCACSNGSLATVKLLLDAGADPEEANRFGDQPREHMIQPEQTERAIINLLNTYAAKKHNKPAEQSDADQPATRPADKVPAKGQPSTPTSKDGPR